MKKVFFIIIFLLTCRSAQIQDVSPPEDYKPAIERAEKFLESGGSGDYKDSFIETVEVNSAKSDIAVGAKAVRLVVSSGSSRMVVTQE